MNTQTKEALEMAIEALEFEGSIKDALKACKEALATNKESSLVQPAQEPVAWMYENDVTKAYFETKESSLVLEYGCKETPLYTHPAQPLSADKLERLAENNFINGRVNYVLFGRAIEAAHEIGVK